MVLDRANMFMYTVDTTLYKSATTLDDLTVALNKVTTSIILGHE